jgi:RNA polymerase sigma factor (TIGR02999 family)
MSDVTTLLQAAREGDPQAIAELLPLVYGELRRLARARMAGERNSHTLEPTALVHEAYLRLVGSEPGCWENRAHFFGAAAEAMRRILVEHARSRHTQKRGGGRKRLDLEEAGFLAVARVDFDNLLELNEALDRLDQEHHEKAALVKLLYFAGLNLEEAAAAQGTSRTTAYRHWLFARAWLFDALKTRDDAQGPDA